VSRSGASEDLTVTTTDDEAASYDEFGMLKIYADHEGIPWKGRPRVERRFFDVGGGQRLSAVAWAEPDPELALLHGSGQNAHTWDSTAMALHHPLIAFDLPGHGHSDWREDRDYSPQTNAEAVEAVISEVTPRAMAVVGMSLGGLTAISLAAQRPDLVSQVVIVDILPAIGERARTISEAQRGAVSLLSGPPTFDSFAEMLQTVAATMPGRPIESLRPGVLHNAKRLEDGRWAWRYDSLRGNGDRPAQLESLWDDLASLEVPLMLVRGGLSPFVHDDDEAKLRDLKPSARIERVEGAGHSVQSDRPLVLAALIVDFLAS
jgi:pimeloyl-ACP methyl ester carboxylesterase